MGDIEGNAAAKRGHQFPVTLLVRGATGKSQEHGSKHDLRSQRGDQTDRSSLSFWIKEDAKGRKPIRRHHKMHPPHVHAFARIHVCRGIEFHDIEWQLSAVIFMSHVRAGRVPPRRVRNSGSLAQSEEGRRKLLAVSSGGTEAALVRDRSQPTDEVQNVACFSV